MTLEEIQKWERFMGWELNYERKNKKYLHLLELDPSERTNPDLFYYLNDDLDINVQTKDLNNQFNDFNDYDEMDEVW